MMTTTPNPFQNLLVPVDIDDEKELTAKATALAMSLAKQFGGTVHFLHVSPPLASKEALAFDHGAVSALEKVLLINLARQQVGLNDLANAAQLDGVDAKTHLIKDARSVADAICAEAKAYHADVIVIASHGRGAFGRAILGSVTDKVAHSAPCPVLIAR